MQVEGWILFVVEIEEGDSSSETNAQEELIQSIGSDKYNPVHEILLAVLRNCYAGP